MRKLVLIFAAFIASFSASYGQKGYYLGYPFYIISEQNSNFAMQYALNYEQIKSNHFKKLQLTKLKTTADKIIWQQVSIFDTSGRMTHDGFFEKGKLTSEKNYNYTHSGKISSYSNYNRHHHLELKIAYDYNENDNITSYKRFTKDSTKASFENRYEYNGKLLIKQSNFKNGKLIDYYVYTYYPDGAREKTQKFNAKDEIVYTWSYNCRPEGEKLYVHKDTTSICKFSEHDTSGKYYTITLRSDEKNKTTRTISTFSRDSVLLETATYNDQEILTNRSIYTGKSTFKENFSFNDKGKPISHSFYEFNADGNKVSYTMNRFKKGEEILSIRYNYTWDDRNFISSVKTTNQNKKVSESRLVVLETY